MKIERRLSEGIASWLIFEQHCNKSGLFNEKYLSFPIGQILSSVFGSNVHAEYIHPVLSKFAKGKGAKPKIDFAVINEENIPIVAIETKWIGQTTPSVHSILWDLIRLELLSREYGTSCIFILGGRRKKLEILFNSNDFALKNSSHPDPILSTFSQGIHGIPITTNDPIRIQLWKPVFSEYQNISCPSKIGTQLFNPFPSKCTQEQFQIYSWRVFSVPNKTIFKPKNTLIYSSKRNELNENHSKVPI
jgi:hypothetical protein